MSGSLHHWISVKTFPFILKTATARPLTFSFVKHQIQRTNARCYASSIFISDRLTISPYFVFNHNFEERLKDKEKLKRNIKQRGCDIDIDTLEDEFKELCALYSRKRVLDEQRRAVAEKIAVLLKDKGQYLRVKEQQEIKEALVDKGRTLKEEHKEFMPQLWDVEEKVLLKIMKLPSDLLDGVTDEDQILEEGFQENKKSISGTHVDMIIKCKDIKLSNVGAKAYYLGNNLAIKEQELLDSFSTDLRKLGFITVLAPEMFKTPILEAGDIDVTFRRPVYRLAQKLSQTEVTDWDTDHTFFKGSSYLSFLAFLARIKIDSACLPLKMFVVGRNYTPARTHVLMNTAGDDSLPGLYGVTQSNKVCICGVAESSEGAINLLHNFKNHLTGIYKNFKLPYRLVSMSVKSLQRIEQNRIELQIWVPSLKKYLKVASLSACSDYSSRRLMIMSSDKIGIEKTPVHMVYGEFADITRMIAILLEYDQIDSVEEAEIAR